MDINRKAVVKAPFPFSQDSSNNRNNNSRYNNGSSYSTGTKDWSSSNKSNGSSSGSSSSNRAGGHACRHIDSGNSTHNNYSINSNYSNNSNTSLDHSSSNTNNNSSGHYCRIYGGANDNSGNNSYYDLHATRNIPIATTAPTTTITATAATNSSKPDQLTETTDSATFITTSNGILRGESISEGVYISWNDLYLPRNMTFKLLLDKIVYDLLDPSCRNSPRSPSKAVDGNCGNSGISWSETFTCLTYIQILCKYNIIMLFNHIEPLGNRLKSDIDSLRSNISKNAIITLQCIVRGMDIYCATDNNNGSSSSSLVLSVSNLLRNCLPNLLVKSINDKKFISSAAMETLVYITKSSYCNIMFINSLMMFTKKNRKNAGLMAKCAETYMHALEGAMRQCDKYYSNANNTNNTTAISSNCNSSNSGAVRSASSPNLPHSALNLPQHWFLSMSNIGYILYIFLTDKLPATKKFARNAIALFPQHFGISTINMILFNNGESSGGPGGGTGGELDGLMRETLQKAINDALSNSRNEMEISSGNGRKNSHNNSGMGSIYGKLKSFDNSTMINSSNRYNTTGATAATRPPHRYTQSSSSIPVLPSQTRSAAAPLHTQASQSFGLSPRRPLHPTNNNTLRPGNRVYTMGGGTPSNDRMRF